MSLMFTPHPGLTFRDDILPALRLHEQTHASRTGVGPSWSFGANAPNKK